MFITLLNILAAEAPRRGIPWWVWLILIVILLVILWFWFGSEEEETAVTEATLSEEPKAEAEEAPAAEEEAEKTPAIEEEAEVEEAVEPDDLKKIEGIGPKVNSLLNEAGITTFAQLAGTELEKLDEILDAARLQYMDPSTWAEQAKLAAAGEWATLEKVQDELSGGRR